ncbi:hypothetical protein LDENG_00001920 [Lucifuga dentata]|nr:hypothetical protein LDENG_00001920 [Lucifuga dentata]
MPSRKQKDMASRAEETSIEASQTGNTSSSVTNTSQNKPVMTPKPRLAPKPFTLQKNTTIRSIHAPKTITAPKSTSNQTGKSEAPAVPKATLTTPTQEPPQQNTISDSKISSVNVHTKDQPKPTKVSQREMSDSPHLNTIAAPAKSSPASQPAPPKIKHLDQFTATETFKAEPVQKQVDTQGTLKASTDIETPSEQKEGREKGNKTQTSIASAAVLPKTQKAVSDSSSAASPSTNPTPRWGSTRKRLSMELTSKFEPGVLSLPPQPSTTSSIIRNKDDGTKPVSARLEDSSVTTSGPLNGERDESALKEECSGGGSIKRRISLLFDSSSRPEVATKKEEPETIGQLNGTGGVKQRIKHWAVERSPETPRTEKKPQPLSRTRTKSFEQATAPTDLPATEKTPKEPPVGVPVKGTSSAQDVDPSSKVSPAESPLEISKDKVAEEKPLESLRETSVAHEQDKSPEGDDQLSNISLNTAQTATDNAPATDEPSDVPHAPRRNNVQRRSVHFGMVQRDDGGPPQGLGPDSDSNTEEEEEEEETEDQPSISVPVYRRAGIIQRQEDKIKRQEEEKQKLLELEKRQRAEENERARQSQNLIDSPIEVVYDDFSVRKPLIDVEFDDFSVKSHKWGSQAKVEAKPILKEEEEEEAFPADEEVEVLEVITRDDQVPDQVEKPDGPQPAPAPDGAEEEEINLLDKEEEEKEEEVEPKEVEDKGDAKQEGQVKSYCTDREGLDTEALIDNQPEQQYGACEQASSETDSSKLIQDESPEVFSEDLDAVPCTEEELAPFPESSTPLLDTRAQRLKADLSKRRCHRTRPPRFTRAGSAQDSLDSRFCDSTEICAKQRESDSEEEQPKPKVVSPPPTAQRVPLFPGVNAAALMAQIKKRTDGGGAGEVEETREEKVSPNEEVAPSPSLLSRSPRSASLLAGAARVLPPLGGSDGGAVSSPSWLKELKSKRRQSQHDADS